MNIIDSSGWIEYLIGSPAGEEVAKYLKPEEVITPTIVIYEVYKKIKRDHSEELAELIAAQMHRTKIVPLDSQLALRAAEISLRYSLPMADAIVYATAISFKARVITSDSHFQGLKDVVYLPKQTAASDN